MRLVSKNSRTIVKYHDIGSYTNVRVRKKGRRVVSQYRDYKNRDGQSWDRQFRDYCEIFFTVTANIVTANHMIVTAN